MIAENLHNIREHIPGHVTLVCVSKFHSKDDIMEAYRSGERIFGESRVQELCDKYADLPKDIRWHFIGHLQTNKIKYIVPFVELIHGVDSFKLLSAIDEAATKADRVVNCLLQMHIAREETKFGFSAEELDEMLQQDDWKSLRHVRICGLMGMATFTDDQNQIAQEFTLLKDTFDSLKQHYFPTDSMFKELSMGMSEDYQIAIGHGSTMVRIGSSIFGARV